MRGAVALALGQRRDGRARSRHLVREALDPRTLLGAAQRAFVHPHAPDMQQHEAAKHQQRDATGEARGPGLRHARETSATSM